jgi:dTDP-4-amino-4,6-dideoxygalactose transaminase
MVIEAVLTAAIQRVLERGLLDWGPEVPAFEQEFAAWIGVPYAVGAASGTAALRLALLALGIGPGDEVITVPNSDISTTAAIHHVGARAVWVDVESDTMNMDPALVEQAITPRTRALLPVHLYGHPADMPNLTAIARRHDLYVIEDACLALGASIDGVPVGAWGDLACFSHAPSKHLGACGSAGTVVTASAALVEQLQLHAGYGQQRARSYERALAGTGQHFLVEGRNERLDELQAAILRAKLPRLSGAIADRCAHAEAYTAALSGLPITLPRPRPGAVHTYRNYVIRVNERAAVQHHLAERGIATSVIYIPPLHLQPAYRHLGHGPGSFPVTEQAAAELIALPIGPDLGVETRDAVIAGLHAILQ